MTPTASSIYKRRFLTDIDGEQIWLRCDQEVGHGGEGKVYEFVAKGSCVKGDDIDLCPREGQEPRRYVGKIYDRPSPEQESKLRMIISKHYQIPGVCFPIRLLFVPKGKRRGPFCGYLMPRAYGMKLSETVFLPSVCEKRLMWTRIELTEFAITLLDRFQSLHDAKIRMGDVNPYNILVRSYDEVNFIDADSYQYGVEKEYRCTVANENFMSPRLFAIRKPEDRQYRLSSDELYAIAVLLFMVFMPGLHPFTRSGGKSLAEYIKEHNFIFPLGYNADSNMPRGPWQLIWYNLPFNLRSAFYRAFHNDDDNYPSISEWRKHIQEYRELVGSGALPSAIFPSAKEVSHAQITLRKGYDEVRGLRVCDSVMDESATNEANVCLFVATASNILFYDLHSSLDIRSEKFWSHPPTPAVIPFNLFDFVDSDGRIRAGRLMEAAPDGQVGAKPALVLFREFLNKNVRSIRPAYHHAVGIFSPGICSLQGQEELVGTIREATGITFGFAGEGRCAGQVMISAVEDSCFFPGKRRLVVADVDEINLNLVYRKKIETAFDPVFEKVKEYGTRMLRNRLFSHYPPQTGLQQALSDVSNSVRVFLADHLGELAHNLSLTSPVTLVCTGLLSHYLRNRYAARDRYVEVSVGELRELYAGTCHYLVQNRHFLRGLHTDLQNFVPAPRAVLSAQLDLCLILPVYICLMELLHVETIYVADVDYAKACAAWYLKNNKQVLTFNTPSV